MKFNQAKTWLMIVGLLFLVFPQSSQAGWFDNDAENAIYYYQGYNRAIAQYAVPYKTTSNTATADTASVSALEKEISGLESQINALSAQVDKLVIDPDNTVDNYVSASTWVTNPMRTDLDTNDFAIGNYSGFDPVYFESDVLIADNELNVVKQDDESVVFSSTAPGEYSTAGFFQTDGYNSTAIHADASNAIGSSLAGLFEGDVHLLNGSLYMDSNHGSNIALKSLSPSYLLLNIGADPDNRAWGFNTYQNNFYGTLMDDTFGGGEHWLEVMRNGYDVNSINFPLGDINISDNLHVGAALPGKISAYTEDTNGVSIHGAANGSSGKAGFFQANGSNAYAVYAVASSTNSTAGYFDGNFIMENGAMSIYGQNGDGLVVGGSQNTVAISTIANDSIGLRIHTSQVGNNQAASFRGVTSMWSVSSDDRPTLSVIHENNTAAFFDGSVKIQSDSTSDSLYVISDGTGMAGRFESSGSDAVYGVAMDDYNTAGHFRHMGENGSAIHAVAYASSSRAGLFEGDVKIDDGDLLISDNNTIKHSTANWHGMILSSGLDVGVIFDRNDDDPISAFRVMTDGDDFDTADRLFSVRSSGNVGIGIDDPNKKLHIYSDQENAEIDIQSGQNTHWGIYQDTWSGDMLFWNEGNRVIFTDYGYVGIGTTTPEHNLDVAGDVNAFEYCLGNECINNWEDLIDILGISTTTDAF
jgi:hypothetical protein